MENTNNKTTAPTSYRITNWKSYNQALAARGSLTVWIEEAALLTWQHVSSTGLPGHPFVYPEQLVVLIGTLKELFHLPLRQTMGFASSLFRLAGLDAIPLPDYSTLQRRLQRVTIPLVNRQRAASEPLILLVDSTGVKVSGEGEWKVRMHGHAKRRKWRKLHIAQDYSTWQLTGMSLSDSDYNDELAVPELLTQARQTGQPVATFIADGAYDKRSVYEVVQAQGGQVVVPPNKAAITHPRDPVLQLRNQHIQQIRASSQHTWKQLTNYHRRSRVETTMFRLKRGFGDVSLTKTDASQYAQLRIRVKLLNYFTELGLPAYGS